ncbi:PilZ domain-containing protein [Paenibacillus sp. OAS669]|uniref:PilZ domain-containing protein n=1 Tax=Paenibacillus sp. OAS669 TaxID=2663821 RepID=UPI00178994DD|nr:PilZ domain-containing protein [Paenibacillus sp. OAS669]MBE1441411.1 hypothetical protein [Paenibacillus sp. OAS669]
MKNIQLLHKGKVYQAHVGYEQEEFMEVGIEADTKLADGDDVLCFDFKRRQNMRILHNNNSKILLVPADSELFHIKAKPQKVFDEWLNEGQVKYTRYKLNTFATISEDFKTTAVRVVDVSRFGIGFEINDFSIKMHEVYDSTMFCDEESIHLKLVVRYAHILEKTIRYGAEIESISSGDLNKFRYYIAMQQFKQMMLA